jgi:hypothetical protein
MATRPDRIKGPSLTELQSLIVAIRDMDLENIEINTIKRLFNRVMDGWKVGVPKFNPGLSLFRARELGSDHKPYSHLRDLSYPPAAVATIQRANREHEPLLYCATGRNSLFFELRAQVGSRLAIVHYKTTATLTLNRIGFTPETFKALKSTRKIPDYGQLQVAQYSDRDKVVNDFLSEIFCQPVRGSEKWRYKLSIAIAEILLNSPLFDGLIYPTIPMFGNMDNLVLKPSYADRYLEPEYAEVLQVVSVEDANLNCVVEDEARSFAADGKVNWLGRRGEWTLRNKGEQLVFEAMNGHWVARDERGQVVHPH